MRNNSTLSILIVLLYSASIVGQYTSDTLDFSTLGNSYGQSYEDLCSLNGKIYAVGSDNSCGNQDNFFAVYDSNLNLLQQQSIGSESFIEYATAVDTLLNKVYYGGVTNKEQTNGYNFVLGTLDTNAFEINNKIIDTPNWSILNDIITSTKDTSIYCIGRTATSYNQWQGTIVKLDTALNILWELEVGGIMDENLVEICSLNDSSFVAVGYTESYGSGAKDVYLVCFSSGGNIIWEQFIGGINDDFGNSVIHTIDDGLAIFGTTASFTSTSEDTYLVKTDNLGNFEWSNLHQVQTATNTDSDVGMDLVQTSDGSYIVFATLKSFGNTGVKDAAIMRTGSGGYWQGNTFLEGGFDDEIVRAVSLNDSTQIFVGNTKSHGYGNEDALIGLGINLPFNNHIIDEELLVESCYLGIEDVLEQPSLSFYPNPSENLIYFNNDIKLEGISITDVTGKLMKLKINTHSSEIDISSFPKGLYIINYVTNNNFASAKLLKK